MELIPFENIYKNNKSFVDYINKRNQLLRIDFKDKGIYKKKITEIISLHHDFFRISKILIKQNRDLLANSSYWQEFEKKLNNPPYFTVSTGQQPGILGGPIYTLFKALSTVHLANWIESTFKIPCIPIFWLVSEDHDIKEITSLTLLDEKWMPVRINNKIPNNYSRLMINRLMCNSAYISSLINRAKDLLPPTIHTNDVLKNYFSFYQSNDDISASFKKFFTTLLRNIPILILDPSDDELKKIVSPIFIRLLDEFSQVSSLLKMRTNDIVRHDYQPQLNIIENQLPFFFIIGNKRYPLLLDDSDNIYLKHTKKVFSRKNFVKILVESPERISCNVISRPLIQDFLLPNIAYIGGPAEINYLMQIAPLYSHLNLPMPIVIPRHSATIIFAKIKKYLSKLNLTPIDILLEKKINLVFEHEEIINYHFKEFQQNMLTQIDNLISKVQTFKINIDSETEIFKSKMFNILEKYKYLCLSKMSKQDSSSKNYIDAIRNTLRPFNKLQERELTVTNLLIFEGEYSVKSIYEKIDLFNPAHYIYEI